MCEQDCAKAHSAVLTGMLCSACAERCVFHGAQWATASCRWLLSCKKQSNAIWETHLVPFPDSKSSSFRSLDCFQVAARRTSRCVQWILHDTSTSIKTPSIKHIPSKVPQKQLPKNVCTEFDMPQTQPPCLKLIYCHKFSSILSTVCNYCAFQNRGSR